MKKISVLFLIVIIFLVAFSIWWQNGSQPSDKTSKETRIFVINKGTSVRQVGNELKEESFIKDPVVFFLSIKMKGIDKSIQAGSYRLSSSMSLPQVIETLQHGTIDVWITIPEGYRAEEIAEVLIESISSAESGWADVLKENEGYLFPDTYLIPQEATISQVVNIMRNNFNTKIETIGLRSDDPKLKEIVTIASLIEREALADAEKLLISSVIKNRLDNNMALDIDATLQYIKGKDEKGNWWSIPTASDRRLVSAYNTYTNVDLPPTPIANPGISAINAALNPSKSPYYFYLHDRNGKVHFAETLEEHNRNVDVYIL